MAESARQLKIDLLLCLHLLSARLTGVCHYTRLWCRELNPALCFLTSAFYCNPMISDDPENVMTSNRQLLDLV